MTDDAINATAVALVMLILLVLCTANALAAPTCREPTPACAALLEVIDDRCADRPRSCRLAVDRYTAVAECERVEVAARKAGAPVLLSLVTAYRESGLNRYAVSSAGAVGLMQIQPRWWCEPGTSCDPVNAGVAALRSLVTRYGEVRGVAYYRSGRAALRGAGEDAARGRLAMADELKRRLSE